MKEKTVKVEKAKTATKTTARRTSGSRAASVSGCSSDRWQRRRFERGRD